MLTIVFETDLGRQSLYWHLSDEKYILSITEIMEVMCILIEGAVLRDVKRQYTIDYSAHWKDQKLLLPIPQDRDEVYLYGDLARIVLANLLL